MASSENELEEQLKEVGNGLLNPPSDTDELLKLLDQAEVLLSNVDQGPPTSTQDAILPLMKALISSELLRHSDMDVKIFVATCIIQITRITAPKEPYDDELMKEVFHLTVAAFEKLPLVSSRCYTKAVSILHIVAKVKASVLMLDLGCHALVLEMFQHFLKSAQSNHAQGVVSSMEYIMTTVLEESEGCPLDLLKTVLSSVRKENQTASPSSWKLGKKVIDNCSAKIQPYFVEAAKSMDIALDDYTQVVASVCQNGSDALKHDNVKDSGKNLVTQELTPSAVCPGEADKSMAAPISTEHNARQNSSYKTLGHCHLNKQCEAIDSIDSAQPEKSKVDPYSGPKKRGRKPKSLKNCEEGHDHAQPDDSLSLKAVISEIEPDLAPKKRDWKPNSLMNPAEGYVHSWMSSGRKKKSAGRRKSNLQASNTSITENYCGEAASPAMLPGVTELPSSETKTEGDAGPSSLFILNEPLGATQCRRGRPKKQATAGEAAKASSLPPLRLGVSSSQVDEGNSQEQAKHPRKESEDIGTLEAEAPGIPTGTLLADKLEEDCSPSVRVVVDKESEVPFNPDEKPHQQSALEVGSGSTNDQSSVPRGSKACREKATSGKKSTEASSRKKISKSATNMSEDNEGTPKVAPKRKRSIAKEEADLMPDLRQLLLGCRIKVWWPLDKEFYEGVVTSYDPVKKKHQVAYIDGDTESLNLRKQRWELVGDDLPNVQMENRPKHDVSSHVPKKRKRKTMSSELPIAGLSSKRRRVSAGISIVEGMKSGSKSADCSTFGEPKVIDEHGDDPSKENDRLMDDDGQKFAGQLEVDAKTAIDSSKIIPETMALSTAVSAGGSIAECMKSGSIFADCSTRSQPKVIDEHENDQSKEKDRLKEDIDEHENDQSKEKNRLKEDGQISAGTLEMDTKTGRDSCLITPETTTLSKGESSKVDFEPSGSECAKEVIELSKDAKNARAVT